jgi:hypothetical protein
LRVPSCLSQALAPRSMSACLGRPTASSGRIQFFDRRSVVQRERTSHGVFHAHCHRKFTGLNGDTHRLNRWDAAGEERLHTEFHALIPLWLANHAAWSWRDRRRERRLGRS